MVCVWSYFAVYVKLMAMYYFVNELMQTTMLFMFCIVYVLQNIMQYEYNILYAAYDDLYYVMYYTILLIIA